MPTTDLNAVVVQRIQLNPGLALFRVAPEDWQIPQFEPGQFAVLGLPASAPRCTSCPPDREPVEAGSFIRRAYSIGSSNRDLAFLEFYISLVPDGGLTPRLWMLQPGDRLHMAPKIAGNFTLEGVPKEHDLLLISTGTGITPYISMLRSGHLMSGGRRVAVVHGVRHSGDLGYRAELEALDWTLDHFDYFPLISRPKDEIVAWNGLVGYAQDVWTKGLLEQHWKRMPTQDDCHIFLCGNPSMIEQARGVLEKDGFTEHTKRSPGSLHIERYW
ncbi:MAG: ferredoxin--NADP reductase [Planctomycetota bacterium]